MSIQARWKIPLAVGVVCVLLAGGVALVGRESSSGEAPAREVASAPASAPTAGARSPAAPPLVAAPGGGDPLDKFLLAEPPGEPTGGSRPDYPVNLEALRARFPDNLYWKLDAPTEDPRVLQQRAEEKREWNALFGKVQSGDASEEEIQRYFDHRRQRSEDYITIASHMLTEGGDRLPENDKGLLALSIRMHRDRLKDLPRQLEDARARKQLQDQRREEWRRSGKAP